MENCRQRAGEGKACCGAVTPTLGAAHLGRVWHPPTPPLTSTGGEGLPRKGQWAHRGILSDKTSTGKEGSRLFSSTFGPQEQPSSRLETSQLRARQQVSPPGPKASRLESTWSGAAAAWTPASPGSMEESVPGIPCLPGDPCFLSKRECPLELRLPFLPLNPEQMGFMLEFPLHEQNFPPEATVSRRESGCPWEPPQGGLAGERAWLEFKDATLGIKGTSPSGGFRAGCLEEVQTELPTAAAQRDTSSRAGATVPAAREATTVSRLRKELPGLREPARRPGQARPAPPGLTTLVTQ